MRVMPARVVAALIAACLLVTAAPVGAAATGRIGPERGPAAVAAEAEIMPAVELRLALGRLLAEHAFLAMEAMRAVALGGPAADSIVEALDDNTDDLAGTLGAAYGDPAATEFARLWRQHIDALVAYAQAVAGEDEAAADRALDALTAYRAAFSQFLASANPHLSADGEAMALQLHLDQLVAYADADYGRAFETGRAAYRHMFTLGDHLAKAVAQQFPERFPGATIAFSPRSELRLTLGRLLGEHLVLSAEAMRAGLAGAPDFADATAALAANTDELAGAIEVIYGADAGAAFGQIWTRHIDAYLAYIRAEAANDAAARGQTLATLRQYHTEIADFLVAANPKLDRTGLETMIRHHVEALIAQVEAHKAGDYRRSVTVTREAYGHMFSVGDGLAAAIADQFPKRFVDIAGPPQVVPPRTDTELPALGLSTPDLKLSWILLAALFVIVLRMVLFEPRRLTLPGGRPRGLTQPTPITPPAQPEGVHCERCGSERWLLFAPSSCAPMVEIEA